MGGKGANKDFDYNLIKILDAVISAGNATKAAKRLSITPAAVSLALRRLQNHYQEELFVRGKEGLLPTAKAIEIHHHFRQVMELINGTFHPPASKEESAQITVLGSDTIESYYFSQLYNNAVFERVLINHFSSHNMSRERVIEQLFTAECDLVISQEPISVPGIDNQMIDSFKSFVCICAANHMFSQLSQLTLHHFYSSRHALYKMNISNPMMGEDNGLLRDDSPYKGQREVGYCSDSVNSLVSTVERTSLIAIMPLKMALFYKNQRKYDIKFVQPPPELTFRSIQVYASWKKNSKNLAVITDVVSMLHTLSSFRR